MSVKVVAFFYDVIVVQKSKSDGKSQFSLSFLLTVNDITRKLYMVGTFYWLL